MTDHIIKKICPKCGSTDSAKILYGLNPLSFDRDTNEGDKKTVLGGCMVRPEDSHCLKCSFQWDHRYDVQLANNEIRCGECDVSLKGKPKLYVNKKQRCFKCASKHIEEIRIKRLPLEREITQKDNDKPHLVSNDEAVLYWKANRQLHVESDRFGFLASGISIIVFTFMAQVIFPGTIIPVVVFIILLVIAIKLPRVITDNRESQFEEKNPRPPKSIEVPREKVVQQLNANEPLFCLSEPEGHPYLSADMENSVLMRDDFSCQMCGKKHEKSGLVVVQLLPYTRHGMFVPTNLVSLCGSCRNSSLVWIGRVGY